MTAAGSVLPSTLAAYEGFDKDTAAKDAFVEDFQFGGCKTIESVRTQLGSGAASFPNPSLVGRESLAVQPRRGGCLAAAGLTALAIRSPRSALPHVCRESNTVTAIDAFLARFRQWSDLGSER